MKCHYVNIKGVGKVLIPGCTAVAWSGDIRDCTCHREPQTFSAFERQEYNKEVKRLKAKIKELEDENEFYLEVLEHNKIENPYGAENKGDRENQRAEKIANYRIQQMCDKIAKDAFNEGKQSVIDNIPDLVWPSGRAETIIGTIELTHCLNCYSFRIGEMRFLKNYDCVEDAMKAANDYYKNRIKKVLGL